MVIHHNRQVKRTIEHLSPVYLVTIPRLQRKFRGKFNKLQQLLNIFPS